MTLLTSRRLLLIRIALCRDWLRAFHHGNDVCGYIAAVPGGAFGNIITRILKLASSTYERAQCGRRQSVEILPRAGEPACCQRRKLGSGGALGALNRFLPAAMAVRVNEQAIRLSPFYLLRLHTFACLANLFGNRMVIGCGRTRPLTRPSYKSRGSMIGLCVLVGQHTTPG